MTFGERLKTLREAAGITQAKLAEASGVPIGTIREYEQVKRDPLLPTAIKLASALGVSIEAFADCAGKPAGKPEPAAKKPRAQRKRK